MNDDAHDWEADLRRGQINAVGVELLRRLQEPSKVIQKRFASSKTAVDVEIKRLQVLFWNEVIVDVCKEILRQAGEARQILQGHRLIVETTKLEQLLLGVERSAQRALMEREQTLKFLKAYSCK